MNATQAKILVVALLIALGLYACTAWVMPLGARALPAILLMTWIYLVTRPIARTWREVGPAPALVMGTLAFQGFVVVWAMMAIGVMIKSFTTGVAPIRASRESAGWVLLALTAPYWWGLVCALAMLYRRAG